MNESLFFNICFCIGAFFGFVYLKNSISLGFVGGCITLTSINALLANSNYMPSKGEQTEASSHTSSEVPRSNSERASNLEKPNTETIKPNNHLTSDMNVKGGD